MGSGRTQDVVGCEFQTFQFKLFVNNVTKFGAPGNRTPLLDCDKKFYLPDLINTF